MRYAMMRRYVLAAVGESPLPTGFDEILAAETECQAEIHHLDQIDMADHVLGQAIEDDEELLTAIGFAVEGDQQGLPAPAGLLAPRRIQHRLVDHRAEHIARCDGGLRVDTRTCARILEAA